MTWTEYLIELGRLMEGDESISSASELPIGTMRQIIEMGERRIYSDVRCRFNEIEFDALTVTDNAATIPDDFEALSIMHFGRSPLVPVDEGEIIDRNLSGDTGETRYVAQAGNSFVFSPAVTNGTEVQGRYFARLDPLSQTTAPTNALLSAEKDLFIYGALVEGMQIHGKFAQRPVWEAAYKSAVDRVNKRSGMAAYSGGNIRVRPSTRLMR